MRTKILIAVLVVFALTTLLIKQQIAYPQMWDEIHLGMTKAEVYDRLGSPQQYWGEKGAFWSQTKITQWQELNVRFEANKVSRLIITEHIGTNKTFVIHNPRMEQ